MEYELKISVRLIPNAEYRENLIKTEAEMKSKYPKPDGVTKTQWEKDQRKKRRFRKEELKRRKLNDNLESNVPMRVFSRWISAIASECECEGEKIRLDNEYCKVCKLISKVTEYALDLFKNAEG